MQGQCLHQRQLWSAPCACQIFNRPSQPTVVDGYGVNVSGATVTGAWSGAKTGTATCTTNAGTCNVVASILGKTSVTFTMRNLAKTGYTYNATANSDLDSDINGSVITVYN